MYEEKEYKCMNECVKRFLPVNHEIIESIFYSLSFTYQKGHDMKEHMGNTITL